MVRVMKKDMVMIHEVNDLVAGVVRGRSTSVVMEVSMLVKEVVEVVMYLNLFEMRVFDYL